VVKEKGEGTGQYFVVLEPGFYICVANKPGYAKIQRRITMKKG